MVHLVTTNRNEALVAEAEVERSRAERIAALKSAHERQIAELESAHAKRIAVLKSAHERQIAELDGAHAKLIAEIEVTVLLRVVAQLRNLKRSLRTKSKHYRVKLSAFLRHPQNSFKRKIFRKTRMSGRREPDAWQASEPGNLLTYLHARHPNVDLGAIVTGKGYIERFGGKGVVLSGGDVAGIPELRSLVMRIWSLAGPDPAAASPTVSIIVPVYNQLVHTLVCLLSILSQPTTFSYEILVTDDASSDGTQDALGKVAGRIRYIRNQKNLGFLRSCNAAAACARGGAVVTFAYIGQALSGQEFIDYVASYDFGSVPPSFVVIHNTAIPDASWAPLNGDPSTKWDRNEAGLSSDAIKTKRKPQLDAIKSYYVGLDWESGPHLFIDERYIWLFTPMYDVGTHAKAGNSYRDAKGVLHYSIGIETVGYFQRNGWPLSMQKLLQIAVQTLRDRLHTFEIIYTRAPINTPQAHDHQISFHFDYNKPGCPGAVITPDYAMGILAHPYATVYPRYQVVSPCAIFTARAPDAPLAGGPDSGQTWLDVGDVIQVGQEQDGWMWVSDNATNPPGIGFLPSSYLKAL
jgi:glycosyltransferase involved in cell wall biosynthesis